ncbi:hypothetical protein FHETE_4154 [Fusarium heterosporum]|uniref:Uncharacterized protein n=1 Tax=Fusarium heterosporum TaxID=42747 RepID=A0A8H5TMW8_FUSHE|nr:hypothetical protein FHETE_4154 [Fusarium heterosporum]
MFLAASCKPFVAIMAKPEAFAGRDVTSGNTMTGHGDHGTQGGGQPITNNDNKHDTPAKLGITSPPGSSKKGNLASLGDCEKSSKDKTPVKRGVAAGMRKLLQKSSSTSSVPTAEISSPVASTKLPPVEVPVTEIATSEGWQGAVPVPDTPADGSGDIHPDPVEEAAEAIVTRDLLQDSLHAQGQRCGRQQAARKDPMRRPEANAIDASLLFHDSGDDHNSIVVQLTAPGMSMDDTLVAALRIWFLDITSIAAAELETPLSTLREHADVTNSPNAVVLLMTAACRIDFASVLGTIEQLKNKSLIGAKMAASITAVRSLCHGSNTKNSQMNIPLIFSHGNLEFVTVLAQRITARQQEDKDAPPLDKYFSLSPTAKALTKGHCPVSNTEHHSTNVDRLHFSNFYSSEHWLLHSVIGSFHENYVQCDNIQSALPIEFAAAIVIPLAHVQGQSQSLALAVVHATDADILAKAYGMSTQIATLAFSQIEPRHHTNDKVGNHIACELTVDEVQSAAPTEDEKTSGDNDRWFTRVVPMLEHRRRL